MLAAMEPNAVLRNKTELQICSLFRYWERPTLLFDLKKPEPPMGEIKGVRGDEFLVLDYSADLTRQQLFGLGYSQMLPQNLVMLTMDVDKDGRISSEDLKQSMAMIGDLGVNGTLLGSQLLQCGFLAFVTNAWGQFLLQNISSPDGIAWKLNPPFPKDATENDPVSILTQIDREQNHTFAWIEQRPRYT